MGIVQIKDESVGLRASAPTLNLNRVSTHYQQPSGALS